MQCLKEVDSPKGLESEFESEVSSLGGSDFRRLDVLAPFFEPVYLDRRSSHDELCVESRTESALSKFRKSLNAARTSGREFASFQLEHV